MGIDMVLFWKAFSITVGIGLGIVAALAVGAVLFFLFEVVFS